MGRALRTESIGTIQEIRLEDRLQNQQRCRLHHTVFHRRDAQRTQLAVSLRNVHPPHRLRLVAFLLQFLLQFDQEIDESRSLVVAAANDLSDRHAIDAGCSSVFRYLVPRRHQRVPPIDSIVQSVESKLRFLLGLLAQLVSQKREFRRHLPLLRSGILRLQHGIFSIQAVLPFSYPSTYLAGFLRSTGITDRKSTRLNSSHLG